MTYVPSPEAVEVVARAFREAYSADNMSLSWESLFEAGRERWRAYASAALVALMGATVTEPCANPRCENGRIYWAAEVGPSRATGFYPCPDCPTAPRSLVVRECEQAGRLEAIECYLSSANGNSCGEPLFREVPPTEETR